MHIKLSIDSSRDEKVKLDIWGPTTTRLLTDEEHEEVLVDTLAKTIDMACKSLDVDPHLLDKAISARYALDDPSFKVA